MKTHEVKPEDFTDEMVELQTGGTVAINKSAGHMLMIHMLNDSGLLRKVSSGLITLKKVGKLDSFLREHEGEVRKAWQKDFKELYRDMI